MQYDLAIIGSGAAGLSAAIYAGRYRMNTIVFGEKFGGESTLAGEIGNWPGEISIDGFELMMKMKMHAETFGAHVVDARVTVVSRSEHCFVITAGEKQHEAHAIIFALGTERRHLGIPNEKELTGKGVHYCVTCDGPLYRDKTIAIVGGGDASVKGVNLAAEYAKKIYLIVRTGEIQAEPVNYEQMKKLGEKVEVMFETEVKEIVGTNRLEKVVLSREYHGSNDLVIDGLFVEIGALPDVGLAQSLGVTLDERGYIMVDNMMKTNVDGVFAAGDTVNHFGGFKQIVTAAAMGSVAATSAYQDRKIHGELCLTHGQPATPKQ